MKKNEIAALVRHYTAPGTENAPGRTPTEIQAWLVARHPNESIPLRILGSVLQGLGYRRYATRSRNKVVVNYAVNLDTRITAYVVPGWQDEQPQPADTNAQQVCRTALSAARRQVTLLENLLKQL